TPSSATARLRRDRTSCGSTIHLRASGGSEVLRSADVRSRGAGRMVRSAKNVARRSESTLPSRQAGTAGAPNGMRAPRPTREEGPMRFLRPAAAVLALTAALAAVPAVASASSSRPIAQVRIAHLSPDASYVDVYAVSLNRDQVFPNVFYKDVSAYWGVAAGAFTYEVRPAGADPTAPAMVSLSGKLQPGRSYTLALARPKSRLNGLLLSDDLSPVGDGKARVRFVDSLLDRGGVDVVAGGKALARGLSLGSASAYGETAPGKRRVRVVRAGTDQTLFDGTLTLRAGAV